MLPAAEGMSSLGRTTASVVAALPATLVAPEEHAASNVEPTTITAPKRPRRPSDQGDRPARAPCDRLLTIP
jgi:hypothetical protein